MPITGGRSLKDAPDATALQLTGWTAGAPTKRKSPNPTSGQIVNTGYPISNSGFSQPFMGRLVVSVCDSQCPLRQPLPRRKVLWLPPIISPRLLQRVLTAVSPSRKRRITGLHGAQPRGNSIVLSSVLGTTNLPPPAIWVARVGHLPVHDGRK